MTFETSNVPYTIKYTCLIHNTLYSTLLYQVIHKSCEAVQKHLDSARPEVGWTKHYESPGYTIAVFTISRFASDTYTFQYEPNTVETARQKRISINKFFYKFRHLIFVVLDIKIRFSFQLHWYDICVGCYTAIK